MGMWRASMAAMVSVERLISMCRHASRQTFNKTGRNLSIDGAPDNALTWHHI